MSEKWKTWLWLDEKRGSYQEARRDGLRIGPTRTSHDWYTNFAPKKSQPVPRHNEIHDDLAKSIIKKLNKE